jgi:hypothetical protein
MTTNEAEEIRKAHDTTPPLAVVPVVTSWERVAALLQQERDQARAQVADLLTAAKAISKAYATRVERSYNKQHAMDLLRAAIARAEKA